MHSSPCVAKNSIHHKHSMPFALVNFYTNYNYVAPFIVNFLTNKLFPLKDSVMMSGDYALKMSLSICNNLQCDKRNLFCNLHSNKRNRYCDFFC